MGEMTYRGHCLCGAVKFTVKPVSKHVDACHCSMCRRWSSGPFMGLDCGSSFEIENGSDLGIYDSSDWAERVFCRKCGSSLFYRLKNGEHYDVDGLHLRPQPDRDMSDCLFGAGGTSDTVSLIAENGINPLTVPTVSLEVALKSFQAFVNQRAAAGFEPAQTKLAAARGVGQPERVRAEA